MDKDRTQMIVRYRSYVAKDRTSKDRENDRKVNDYMEKTVRK